jgi:hypothetical protein
MPTLSFLEKRMPGWAFLRPKSAKNETVHNLEKLAEWALKFGF